MHHLRLLIVVLATLFVLAVAVMALVHRTQPAAVPGDIIIIKGGSLTIECPNNTACLEDSGNGKYDHKENKDKSKNKKIQLIVVKDEDGNVLGSFGKANFQNGKPTIEITYK